MRRVRHPQYGGMLRADPTGVCVYDAAIATAHWLAGEGSQLSAAAAAGPPLAESVTAVALLGLAPGAEAPSPLCAKLAPRRGASVAAAEAAAERRLHPHPQALRPLLDGVGVVELGAGCGGAPPPPRPSCVAPCILLIARILVEARPPASHSLRATTTPAAVTQRFIAGSAINSGTLRLLPVLGLAARRLGAAPVWLTDGEIPAVESM
jgi:hypothetical protein